MRRLLALLTAAMLIGAVIVPSAVSANSSTKGCQGYGQTGSTIQLPAGYWTVGVHTYWTHYVDTNPDPAWTSDQWYGPFTFTVDPNATLHMGNVILPTLDFWGTLYSVDGPILDNTINPAQKTFFYGGWAPLPMTADTWIANNFPGTPYNRQQWKAEMAMSPISFRWDSGPAIIGNMGPLQSYCVGSGSSSFFLRTYGKKF